tara:strand:+ start:473 stop:700 length:228 start_codon:yes stop_codon:yes gene_type:complete
MSKENYFKNTEKTSRNKPLNSSAINDAMEVMKQSKEDALVANTKNIYQQVSPQNDNSQLNKYLYPPYTTDKKGMA